MRAGGDMISATNQAVVVERDAGDTLAEIGKRHGITHQRVSAIVAQATQVVNRMELDLMVARKTGEHCAYLIPHGPDYTLALAFSDSLIRRLRARGVDVEITTRRASNG